MTKAGLLLRYCGAFVAALILTTVLGSLVQTQINLADLQRLGVEISAGVRLDTSLADLLGFTPNLGGILFAGFVPAFLVAGLLSRYWPARRRFWFALAGATAFLTAIAAMQLLFQITAVAAVRHPSGLLALSACAALGAYLFARLTERPIGTT